jgi:hypothetical protein
MGNVSMIISTIIQFLIACVPAWRPPPSCGTFGRVHLPVPRPPSPRTLSGNPSLLLAQAPPKYGDADRQAAGQTRGGQRGRGVGPPPSDPSPEGDTAGTYVPGPLQEGPIARSPRREGSARGTAHAGVPTACAGLRRASAHNPRRQKSLARDARSRG